MKKFADVDYTINNGSYEITKIAHVALNSEGVTTLEECKEIIEKISKAEGSPVIKIKIDLNHYAKRNQDGTIRMDYDPDCGESNPNPPIGKIKYATYTVATNTLRIWENGMPIYENENGVICRDKVVLADCLMH